MTKWSSITCLIGKYGGEKPQHSQQVFSYGVFCEKPTFESHKNMSTSAPVLAVAACISDVMSKVGLSGQCIKYIMNQPFSALHL